MTRKKRLLMILGVVVVLVIADQLTKYMAILWLRQRSVIPFPAAWFPHDLFRFQYATNTGAFLSLGSSLGESARFWLLTGLNTVILVAVAAFVTLRRDLLNSVALSLALILSGGIGNLIDRVFRDGVVIDFMNMGIGYKNWGIRTGIFNIADLAIVAGLVLLMASELWRGYHEKQEAATEAS